jgi:hypothetical protein
MIIFSGCSDSSREPGSGTQIKTKQPVVLARQFTVGDKATYVSTIENSRAVEFEGAVTRETDITGGITINRAVVTFTEEIESIDSSGNASAKITILSAKYFRELAKRGVTADYDTDKDKRGPLSKLVGQSYRIEITPWGEVTRVLDSQAARAAVKSDPVASGLLKADPIKQRHSITSLPEKKNNLQDIGGSWSNIKTADFGMMGKKAYERIYVLREMTQVDGRKVAVVEMNAIPTVDSSAQTSDDQGGAFSQMFDNMDEYKGLLKLDLATGNVIEYFEKVETQWKVMDPSPPEKNKDNPDTVTMTGIMDQRLERID